MKTQIIQEIDYLQDILFSLSDSIGHNPELGMQEFQSAAKLTGLLREHGFTVEMNICGYETAFKAVYDSGKTGPTIAFFAEYDALPEIGHGCGHNMIGVMAVGAGIGLSKVLAAGRVTVWGTPAEETMGAKVAMARDGVLAEVDAAILVHPHNKTYASGVSLAMDALQFEFKGQTSHAASAPEKGINALDAVIQTFNATNALRQHVASDVRIHGIITKGGVAANVVPDHAIAQFYVRARRRKALDEVVKKVKNCAQAAALATGAELIISNYQLSYDDMNTNQKLSETFNSNLRAVGETNINPPPETFGSIDMGNVSGVVPAIHPYIGIGDETLVGHTAEMAAATFTPAAHQALLRAAKAMALSGYDVITKAGLLAEIKKEFCQSLIR
ncbi:p-aminobenzoyl-glutamate hydrolase subunit B [Sporomusa ovata DSM 2662]|uniref:Peptidase M20 domain-containing protein 2 n=1 Tax=Sporomusa ovata TaxID=2378 RepID=A0A0U1KZG0_9FIRM|nr:M20 family metallopeptidase [Sporomusa ovata]EQB27867.1 p-aminobenzoyl-glutamate hydrolase subunit B [Sporomusa ovata DSM 2662]CQR72801.1 Catalyzes the cleavage of p-aminobenzoyl-glutamate to p-aminobenzoate and glutamate, subunit A [Sporomusa ovata]